MSCVQHRFPELPAETDDLLSWTSIAAAVRGHSRSLPPGEAEELRDFADLLDGFAELAKAPKR